MRMGKRYYKVTALFLSALMVLQTGMTAYAEKGAAQNAAETLPAWENAISNGDAVSSGDAVSNGDAVSGGDAVSNSDAVSSGDTVSSGDAVPEAEGDLSQGDAGEASEEPSQPVEAELTGELLEEPAAAFAAKPEAPKNLKLNNRWTEKELSWDAVEGADRYEIYYAVDYNLEGSSLDISEYSFLGTSDTNSYVSVVSENGNIQTEGDYPVEQQYFIYRVRAVCSSGAAGTGGTAEEGSAESQTSGETAVAGEFSEPVSANGMYMDTLSCINAKRKEYGAPGTGDYVRFYLGNAEGIEYNASNPINLHVGESIDGLTLWAVCEDGTRVSYCDIRDAIAAYEMKEFGNWIVYPEYMEEQRADTYGFTWSISGELSTRANVAVNSGDRISSLIKYGCHPVPDQLGFKAVSETEGTEYLAVALNNSLAPSSVVSQENAMTFVFFVPVNIEAAEAGAAYEDPDRDSRIYTSGEEFFRKIRETLYSHADTFTVLLTAEAYDAFIEKYDYYDIYTLEDGTTQKSPKYLLDEVIMNTWMFTQYEEQDWMEPWAGDYLLDASQGGGGLSCRQELLNGEWVWAVTGKGYYMLTEKQERELDAEIQRMLGEGGVLHEAYTSGDDLKKIKAAFDFTKGIKWVSGLDDPMNYTVYSGVFYRKGSCESSCMTFARLCHEMGVQARVIKDNLWGGAGNHAYNIVRYGELWYYVDCTDGRFMRGSDNFKKPAELELYRSEKFTKSHPISKTDYELKKITYNLNGGTNAPTNPEYYEPGEVLTFAPAVKTGYLFEGWYADSAFGTQITGPEGGTYDTALLTGNLVLYAKWKTGEYTLSYDMNIPDGATVKKEDIPEDVTVRSDVSVRLSTKASTLYKYRFTGWNTAADGSGTAYKAGASVKNLAASGTFTLYAQWAPTAYTVKYDSNASSLGLRLSAKGRTANTVMKFWSEDNKTAANGFTIAGYRFTGWNTRADGKGLSLATEQGEDGIVSGAAVIGTALETSYAGDTGAVVYLYAQWEAVPYTVQLYLNDGTDESGPALSLSMNTGETLSSKLAAGQITRNGYKLASWNTAAEGKGRKYALNAKNLAKPGESITLYARWSKPVSYKITYDLQGGKNASRNPKKYTVLSTEEQRTLLAPVKKGYTFVKWVDASAQNPEEADAVTVISTKACRNVRLRAVWRENSYQVTYHGADERYTSVTATVTKTYKYTELADAFAPAGEYTLKEGVAGKAGICAWTTAPGGKGKAYAIGKGFSKLSADNFDASRGRGMIDLYAKWGTPVYKITYENCSKADGVRNSNAASYVYREGKEVSVKKPSRAGYVFAGWTAPEGTDYFDRTRNKIKAGTSEDVVLTANWTPITYAVKLQLNVKNAGVSFKTNAQTVYGNTDGTGIAYDTAETSFVTQDVVNIPEYYELVGWNTKANGKGIAAECLTDATGSVTGVNLAGLGTKNKGTVKLYAIWKPKTYTITYQNVDPDSGEELSGVKASNPSAYTYNASKKVKLKNPVKNGFVFEGWYRSYDADEGVYADKVTSIPKGSCGDITLYGKWRVK